MAIRPVRRGDDARLVRANERDGLIEMRGILADAAVGPMEVLAPGGAEHEARGLGFRQALVHGPVRTHLAG